MFCLTSIEVIPSKTYLGLLLRGFVFFQILTLRKLFCGMTPAVYAFWLFNLILYNLEQETLLYYAKIYQMHKMHIVLNHR